MTSVLMPSSLFRILQDKDAELAARLADMQVRALNDWMSLLVPDQGSHSGLLHIINVGRNIDKILPDNKKGELAAGEIFLLLAATLLHDIGRIVPPGETSNQARRTHKSSCPWAQPTRKKKPAAQNDARPCARPHWDHHRQSQQIIEESGLDLGLPDDMAVHYCALLAYCHKLAEPPRKTQPAFPGVNCREREKKRPDFRNTSVEPLGPVRIPLLAAILRIADETDNLWTRAFNDRWLDLYRKHGGNVGKAFRRRVEDVEFCHAGACIVMHLASPPEQGERKRFATLTAEISRVLKNWAGELRPLNVQFDEIYYEVQGRFRRITLNENRNRVREVSDPMTAVLDRDREHITLLVNALTRLSQTTLGHGDFSWTSVEAEVGRRLTEHDKWLINRIIDWVPGAISVDHQVWRVLVKKDTLADMRKQVLGRQNA